MAVHHVQEFGLVYKHLGFCLEVVTDGVRICQPNFLTGDCWTRQQGWIGLADGELAGVGRSIQVHSTSYQCVIHVGFHGCEGSDRQSQTRTIFGKASQPQLHLPYVVIERE